MLAYLLLADGSAAQLLLLEYEETKCWEIAVRLIVRQRTVGTASSNRLLLPGASALRSLWSVQCNAAAVNEPYISTF